MNSFEYVYNNKDFNGVLHHLQEAFIQKKTPQLTSSTLSKTSWLVTYLSNSDNELHKNKAQLYAALCFYCFPNDKNIQTLAYTIFSRIGILPATQHLKQIINNNKCLNINVGLLTEELILSYCLNFVQINSGLLLSDFQKNVLNLLSGTNYGVFSAPTSAGKSFIIHEYIKSQILKQEKFCALIVVPTKALISETCAKYRKFSQKCDIKIDVFASVPDSLMSIENSTIFILTQERCIKLLTSSILTNIKFVFIDEIQAIEEQKRGLLLEYVINELISKLKNTQFFGAGPFVRNIKEIGVSILSDDAKEINTLTSPVSQLIVKIKPIKQEKSLLIEILDNKDYSIVHNFNLQTRNCMYSRWQGNITKAIIDSICLFSNNTPSIVFAKGQMTARNYAVNYVNEISEHNKEQALSPDIEPEVEELIDYIQKCIHPKCSLINCLQHKVAYHNAGLTEFIRNEIENLFKDHKLNIIFCTPTLMQGVNLPADKIFVASPNIAKGEKLTKFEFKNLIGRAGRLQDDLCGTVYCIQIPEKGNDWIDDFQGETDNIKSASETILQRSIEDICENLKTNKISTSTVKEISNILKIRYLKSEKNCKQYLLKHQVNEQDANEIITHLKENLKYIKIPTEIILKNPTIDPILQDMLYNSIISDAPSWKMRSSIGMATDFKALVKKLDDIFNIMDEIEETERYMGNKDWFRNTLCSYALDWLRGKQFSDLVDRTIKQKHFDKDKSSDVDKAINITMTYISKHIGFTLSKYFSLLADVINKYFDDEEDYGIIKNLHNMLELGSMEPIVLSLMNSCLPRSVALELSRYIPVDIDDPIKWLIENKMNNKLKSLPSIYKKSLIRNGIWIEKSD